MVQGTSDTKEDAAFRAGTGNWKGVLDARISLDTLMSETNRWARALEGIERPWLCWNVDNDWNVVQQRLVRSVGWTPLVGFDPRVGPPPLEPGSVLIDFNAMLKLPTMWMHFPMEFIFRYCDRLAYWHADCLIREDKMRHFANMFANLRDGEMAAVRPAEGIRLRLSTTERRFWEVLGCSTRGASQSQFDNGCGWWMNFPSHPSTPADERLLRQKYHWECGIGIWYWNKRCHGVVHEIPESEIAEGHFTSIGRKDYKRASPKDSRRDLSRELSLNNDLTEACRKLGISRFLAAPDV